MNTCPAQDTIDVIDSRTVDGVIEKKARYVGYGEKYDEWLPAFEVVRTPRVEPKNFQRLLRWIWLVLEFL